MVCDQGRDKVDIKESEDSVFLWEGYPTERMGWSCINQSKLMRFWWNKKFLKVYGLFLLFPQNIWIWFWALPMLVLLFPQVGFKNSNFKGFSDYFFGFIYLFNNVFKVDKITKIQYTYIHKSSQTNWLI